MKELIKLIMEREGKKHQATIGDLREILKVLATILANDPDVYTVFKHYVAGKNPLIIADRKKKRESK